MKIIIKQLNKTSIGVGASHETYITYRKLPYFFGLSEEDFDAKLGGNCKKNLKIYIKTEFLTSATPQDYSKVPGRMANTKINRLYKCQNGEIRFRMQGIFDKLNACESDSVVFETFIKENENIFLISILKKKNLIFEKKGNNWELWKNNLSDEEINTFINQKQYLYYNHEYTINFKPSSDKKFWEIDSPDKNLTEIGKKIEFVNISDKYVIFDRNSEKVCFLETKENEYVLSDNIADSLYETLPTEKKNNPFPHNRIIFGAPGTGKSYQLQKEASKNFEPANIERVTFHPNYSYAHFVGTYKPMQADNGTDIKYEYVPGPFMRTYANAIKYPETDFLLIIEEINRANVAAVFGDVFQLLDRDSDGNSEYPVAASEDIKKFLEDSKKEKDENGQDNSTYKTEELSIPYNMYIWATMNSADQGVFPMDAAFKRRWNFEYLGIDNNADKVQNYNIPANNGRIISWNDFRTKLNQMLIKETKVNEDKLLGPFFLSKNALENALNDKENFIKLFKSKVLMYLFEDVVKMNPGKLFKDIGGRDLRYSEICNAFDEKGEGIFGISCDGINNSGQGQ